MKLYPYVGPAEIARLAETRTIRHCVTSAAETHQWIGSQPEFDKRGGQTLTFVVLPDGLWIAPRRSEHVACARGGPVLAAGEMTFELEGKRRIVAVTDVSNQSTGFCPEPESWPAVAARLDAAGIEHPGDYTVTIHFRRCLGCGATNIVKDGWFVCTICDADLPPAWNY